MTTITTIAQRARRRRLQRSRITLDNGHPARSALRRYTCVRMQARMLPGSSECIGATHGRAHHRKRFVATRMRMHACARRRKRSRITFDANDDYDQRFVATHVRIQACMHQGSSTLASQNDGAAPSTTTIIASSRLATHKKARQHLPNTSLTLR